MVNLDFVGGTPLNPQGNEVFGGLPLEAEVASMRAANAAKKPEIRDEERTVAYDMVHGGVRKVVYEYSRRFIPNRFYKITGITKDPDKKAEAKITFLRGDCCKVNLDEILGDVRAYSGNIEREFGLLHEQALEEYARRARAKSPEDDIQF